METTIRFNTRSAVIDYIFLLYFLVIPFPLPTHSTNLGPTAAIDQNFRMTSCNKTTQHDTSLNKNNVNNPVRPPNITDGSGSVRVNSDCVTSMNVQNVTTSGSKWILSSNEHNVMSRKLQVSDGGGDGDGANSANYSDIFRIKRTKKLAAMNKSFSLVLVNPFKVNEVFEKERSEQTESVVRNSKGKIVLLGLFELTTKAGVRPEGLGELAAAQMAVQHINQQKLLPGYTLELVTNDTECDPGVGVDRFFHALYTQHSTRMVMLLGSACSEVTESLAKVVPYWNIVQVSFGSTSPALSDRHEFPFFFRTVAPDSSHNPARIAFIRKFGWDTVTTFSQNEEVHSLAVNDLVTELEAANISCAATITFAETDFKDQLLLLRDLDTRIIIGSFSQELAPKIFCEAFKLGMFGADYAWILHESMGPPWWHLAEPEGCLASQLERTVENVIIVSSHNSIVGNRSSYSGLSNDMFVRHLTELQVPEPLSKYVPQTYDAVWAIALALRGAEDHWIRNALQSKLDRFDYTRYDMAQEFLRQLGKLNFLGVSGPVSFSGPDRIGTSAFYQIQRGSPEPVALYYPAEQNLDFACPNCKIIKWHSGQVPIARRVFKLKVATIAPVAFYTMATLASFGIALAIVFLAFNLHFRKRKTIKLSSPKLSNITAVGCILVYAAVVLLGLDHSTLPSAERSFATICTARVYLLSAGFSLAFGSMFAKTYRVHRIFTRAGGGVCKDKMLRDTQLISLVCALLLLDGLVVTLWVVMDPIERHLNNLTLEISSTDRSVVYQPQVEVCRSQYTQSWLGVLYAYKGLLLIVGVYMAWETRHVKIPALNDSQYIGVSVYSVVITSAIVVVLANLISERVTLAFITITALILASTTATLCLLFLPKLNEIWDRSDVVDPVIHSMGLKMECNTRRFVIDDKRELQYRVEVQNRVYKKEIAALDAEIRRLERLLEGNSSTSSSNVSLVGPQKPEVSIISEISHSTPPAPKSRTPSISGGLPYLLLSVLPPVIPRASWPSAEYMQVPMRRSVTFASQPQLEDSRSVHDVCLPAADLFNLRLAHQQATENKAGFMTRIRGIFTRSTSHRSSSNSLSGQSGIKAVIKSHMGMFTRFIPSAETASCNALYNTPAIKPLRKMSLAKSGNDIDQTTIDPGFFVEKKLSLTTVDEDQPKYIKVPETKVNFQLPANRRPSIIAQPTLRERTPGSPRFPHRIVPTCSLSALEEKESSSTSAGGRFNISQTSTSPNWKSMEVANTKSLFSLEDQNVFTISANNSCIDQIYVLPETPT